MIRWTVVFSGNYLASPLRNTVNWKSLGLAFSLEAGFNTR